MYVFEFQLKKPGLVKGRQELRDYRSCTGMRTWLVVLTR